MSKRILIVDDSATVRQQLRVTLEQAAFQVVEAVDGLDGLQKAQAHADLGLCIADVNMPRMNGLEMIEQLRKIRPALPVVMLTTEGQPDMIARAKAAGAKGWIVKPFKANLLVAAAQKLTT